MSDTDNVTRLRPAVIADGAKIGAGLTQLGNHIARNVNGAYAVVIVIDGDDVPSMWAFGRNPNGLTCHDVSAHISRASRVMWRWREDGASLDEMIHDEHTHSLKMKAALATRQAEKNAESPWVCEYCNRRFKTARGAERHESGCTSTPRGTGHGCVSSQRTPHGLIHTCRCGWATPPSTHGWNWSPALRAHFNEHHAEPAVPTLRETS